MNLRVEWTRPLLLNKAKKADNLIYRLDSAKVPEASGVYIFGRKFGEQFEALYVGKADNLRSRAKGHLRFNLQLMLHLLNAKSGKRILLVGKLVPGRGQRMEKCLRLAERALIRHFLSEGHDLANKNGVRIRRHEIDSSGNHPKRYFPRTIYLERSKGE